jgi:subtilisin family serine protease
MIRAAAFLAAAALFAPAHAMAARFAVGVDPGASVPRVAADLKTYGHVSRDLARMRVLVVDGSSVRGVKRIGGVRWVEWLGSRRRSVAFTPTDPLASKQWYLQQDHAFDFWPELPVGLPEVKVAIVDSGIDLAHPDLASRILLARSFVSGSVADTQGHGTFVAGQISAAVNNAEGIAGIGIPAQLLVAKVVRADGTVSLEAEANAIRWAVDQGARVINLSLGGLRDPKNPSRDTYSPLEAAAVDYAAANGVVLVAALGNSDQAPTSPWPYASYPSALPHVVGVSSLTQDGSVSSFSDRDLVYNDIAAPGEDIISTLPRAMTRENPSCVDQGYSDCGPADFRHSQGTSFAAPQVSAAAALLIAQRPSLSASQTTTTLERAADDVNASTGCSSCPAFRDALSGWGRLNIAAALTAVTKGSLPPPDRFETNDDVGAHAPRLAGVRGTRVATVDYWDDQTDVYPVDLTARRRLSISLVGEPGTAVRLRLWSPQTRSVFGAASKLEVARSKQVGDKQRLTYVVPSGGKGRYYLQVTMSRPGAEAYTLRWSKR